MKSTVGIDVSKRYLDVHYQQDDRRFEQTPSGYRGLRQWIRQSDQELLVVCEASGGYERPLIKVLTRMGIETHVAHANKVKAFGKATGYRAKTDKLDAKLIAEYAQTMQLSPQPPVSVSHDKMRGLLKRRDQLVRAKQDEQHRLDKVTGRIKTSIKRHIKWLDKEIAALAEQLAEQVKADPDLKKQSGYLTSIPGVGQLSASMIMAYLPEAGQIPHKALSSLVGVAPFNHDSGQHTGKRFIQGGRTLLRQLLYMVALSAIRCNASLKKFYLRLRDKGKPAKVAIIAVIRKLVCLINSLLKRQTTWTQNAPFSLDF